MQSPFAILYHYDVVRDDHVQVLIGVKARQLRSLIARGKLSRVGHVKYHNLTCASVRRYIGLPDTEPESYEPWDDSAVNYDLRQSSEVSGSVRQSSV